MKQVWNVLGRCLRAVVPVVGDRWTEWVRKLTFWLALIVFLCAAYYVVDDVWLQPQYTQEITHSLRDLYTVGDAVVEDEPNTEETPVVYPEDLSESFQSLYRRNTDVAGWLTFTANQGAAGDLFEGAVDNPFVQAKDNDYYLRRNYLRESSRDGTLFLDYRNDVHALDKEHNVVIYGHNLNSGLMFSRFNRLVSGDVNRARALTTLTIDSAYGSSAQYKVFAVMVIDADATGTAAFDYIRTEFSNDAQMETFIARIRERSLYDFGDVDVLPTDTVLTLSTCSNKRDTTLKNGRTVIVARRVRDGESTAVDTTKTTLNGDVLMPKAWYVHKGKPLPTQYQ